MKNQISLTVGLALLFNINQTLAQDNEFHLDEVYSIKRTGTLTLSSDNADVFIVGSD
jgi:hypothetical protein